LSLQRISSAARSGRSAISHCAARTSRLRDADQKAIADLRQKNVELSLAYAELEEQQRVRAALRLLTPEQRQVIVLRFLEEWSLKEVAEVMQKPVGAVKALQHRALAALRRILEEEPHE
jgi:RNA polymerase sigma factor (sigma-70 family)